MSATFATLPSNFSIHLTHGPAYASCLDLETGVVLRVRHEGALVDQLNIFFPLSQRDRANHIATLINEVASFFPEPNAVEPVLPVHPIAA